MVVVFLMMYLLCAGVKVGGMVSGVVVGSGVC